MISLEKVYNNSKKIIPKNISPFNRDMKDILDNYYFNDKDEVLLPERVLESYKTRSTFKFEKIYDFKYYSIGEIDIYVILVLLDLVKNNAEFFEKIKPYTNTSNTISIRKWHNFYADYSIHELLTMPLEKDLFSSISGISEANNIEFSIIPFPMNYEFELLVDETPLWIFTHFYFVFKCYFYDTEIISMRSESLISALSFILRYDFTDFIPTICAIHYHTNSTINPQKRSR